MGLIIAKRLIMSLPLGAAGLVLLALAFLASLLAHQPRMFTLLTPVGAGLLLAQSVSSTAKLSRLPPNRPVRATWIVSGQAAAALICWLVLAWLFWGRS
jgi:hypothetical protein